MGGQKRRSTTHLCSLSTARPASRIAGSTACSFGVLGVRLAAFAGRAASLAACLLRQRSMTSSAGVSESARRSRYGAISASRCCSARCATPSSNVASSASAPATCSVHAALKASLLRWPALDWAAAAARTPFWLTSMPSPATLPTTFARCISLAAASERFRLPEALLLRLAAEEEEAAPPATALSREPLAAADAVGTTGAEDAAFLFPSFFEEPPSAAGGCGGGGAATATSAAAFCTLRASFLSLHFFV